MACTALHLQIAYEYCKNNSGLELGVYFWGAILPDIAKDKTLAHYGTHTTSLSVKEQLNAKIDIIKCIKSLNLNEEEDRAVFLHLLTDYVYYNYLYIERSKNLSVVKVLSAINNDSGTMTNEILKNYHFQLPEEYSYLLVPKQNDGTYQLFKGEKLNMFAKVLSSVDIDDCVAQILKDKNKFLNNIIKQINESEDFTTSN